MKPIKAIFYSIRLCLSVNGKWESCNYTMNLNSRCVLDCSWNRSCSRRQWQFFHQASLLFGTNWGFNFLFLMNLCGMLQDKLPRFPHFFANHLLVTLVSWTQTISASRRSRAFLIPPLKVLIPFMFQVTTFIVKKCRCLTGETPMCAPGRETEVRKGTSGS